MPSSYSSLLRLELMAVGEKSNTWGDITNTNLGTLLEKAIAGAATIDVTAGNVTLSATNGADDQARCAMLIVTGTPGVSRNIVAPSSSKLYVVINGSNGNVKIKGSSTTGVTLASGSKSVVAWNGSDFVSVGLSTDSPAFTGTPTAPTAAVDTATTQLATTAFVVNQAYAKLASPALTGNPTAPTQAVDNSSTRLATTAYVVGQGYAKLVSPALTGNPTAPTQAVDNSSTRLATTAYVIGQGYLKSSTAASTYAPLGGSGTSGTWGINISGNAATATDVQAGGEVGGIEIGYRRVVAASVTSGAFVAADSGKCVYATSDVTVPNSVMSQGDVVTIYNNTGSSITITASVTTLRQAGTTNTGDRTLAARGLATVLFVSPTLAVISGSGVT